MTPASLLPVKPGSKVLDMCAAPGGKTTELGARLKGEGVLITNDISNSRAKALLKNVELFGIRNAIVVSEPPARLAGRFEGYFDSILVDAPCSGEGMFRMSRTIIKNWEQYGNGYYAEIQRDILPHAVRMLAPGGYLLYSTCTFSPEEDEALVAFILDNYPEMEIVPAIDFNDPRYAGFEKGMPQYAGGRRELEYALRLYPHRIKGEGHFIALLRKKENSSENVYYTGEDSMKDTPEIGSFTGPDNREHDICRKLGNEAPDFLKKIGLDAEKGRLQLKNDRLYLVPKGLPDLGGLRILRSGLLIGELKNGRFEPSQALACALNLKEYDNILDLDPEDSDCIKYLKCESFDCPAKTDDGYVLVCAGGFPLGWGKVKNGRMKNRYLPGWRMQ